MNFRQSECVLYVHTWSEDTPWLPDEAWSLDRWTIFRVLSLTVSNWASRRTQNYQMGVKPETATGWAECNSSIEVPNLSCWILGFKLTESASPLPHTHLHPSTGHDLHFMFESISNSYSLGQINQTKVAISNMLSYSTFIRKCRVIRTLHMFNKLILQQTKLTALLLWCDGNGGGAGVRSGWFNSCSYSWYFLPISSS